MTDANASVLDVLVADPHHLQRIDRVLVEATALSRSQAAKLLKAQRVWVNEKRVTKASTKVQRGDRIVVHPHHEDPDIALEPQALPLSILFEDDDIIVVAKPAGMVVHPAPGHEEDTLVHALLHHFPPIEDIGEQERPGIVHRLDRDTSGAIIAAKTNRAYDALRAAFKEQHVHRQYIAVTVRTRGEGLADHGTIETRHGRDPVDRRKFTGKEGPRIAITHYEKLERFQHGASLLRCRLQTGRTHQIRVHLSEQGMPILGDSLYGGKAVSKPAIIQRMALHAEAIGIALPWMPERIFEAPWPADLTRALEKLRKGANWR